MELEADSEPIALAVIWLSPACKGTPYHVCVMVLLVSSNSDRPIELGSTAFPFTKSSILALLGIWITTVAAGASKTVPTVGERITMRGDELSDGLGVLAVFGISVTASEDLRVLGTFSVDED